MKSILPFLLTFAFFTSCQNETSKSQKLKGTWTLISSVTERKDTTITRSFEGQKMIKIISDTHFAFFHHDLNKGKDSTNLVFVSGGGTCKLENDQYTENLQYCNYREWEGVEVKFSYDFQGDTLTLTGLEENQELGVSQKIIERYLPEK